MYKSALYIIYIYFCASYTFGEIIPQQSLLSPKLSSQMQTVICDDNKSVNAIISIIFHQTCDILGGQNVLGLEMKRWFVPVTIQRTFTLNVTQS
jgi:hypothetical protein